MEYATTAHNRIVYASPPCGFDFNIPTALKGWVGHAAKRRGALHIIII